MSQVNQLLAKAMSTVSEDEAIACLRMARKKGNTVEQLDTKDSVYWKDKAKEYYNSAVSLQRMYRTSAQSAQYLQSRIDAYIATERKLRRDNTELSIKLLTWKMSTWLLAVILFGVVTMLIMTL